MAKEASVAVAPSAKVTPFAKYLYDVFAGLATSDIGQKGTTPKPHATAYKAVTLYCGYLYAMDLVGNDITEARESVGPALQALGVEFRTKAEEEAEAFSARKAEREREATQAEARARMAANIQSKALGVDPAVLLAQIDKARATRETADATA